VDILTKEKYTDLLQTSDQLLISIYMPTHRVGREMQQDPIRLKNLLSKAEQLLLARGSRKPEAENILKPAQTLLEDKIFWQHQSDGLALFITTDFIRYYRLPIDFEELLVIAERFHLKPLLPLLHRNGHYYLLALSQKQVRLLEGSLFNIDEIDLENAPDSLSEALRFDDPERQLQYHTGSITPGGGGARPAVFHGQGISDDDTKTDLLRYFQQVDRGLMEMLADEKAPLVLAGVDYLLPIYQEANNYSHLVEEAIKGNPDEVDAADLHQQAWEIVEPIFDEDLRQALVRYRELSGSESDLASDNLKSIIPAAHYGRVDTLFVALGEQVWGSFDASKNRLERHQEFTSGDQDLLDLAALQTFLNDGNVYALEPDKIPGKAPLAAIFRYAYEG
jgi:hypothetical protein